LTPTPSLLKLLNKGYVHKLKILVVDDAEPCRKLHIKLMKEFATTIQEAGTGVEAVELVRESISSGDPFDVIFMDNSMPEMDGPSATKEIRQIGFEGKVVGVTGYAEQADIDNFVDSGADEILVKPVKVAIFKKVLVDLGTKLANPIDL
jgi:CheY-like chemotaxis protein